MFASLKTLVYLCKRVLKVVTKVSKKAHLNKLKKMMMNNSYLDAIVADYRSMIEKLQIVEQNCTGFHALSFSTLEEVKEAYNSEKGKKIRRNAYKIYCALQALKESLETVED